MNHSEAPGLRARTIALLYACFAGLWIVLSDYGLATLISSPLLLQELEVYKGLAFVAVTSVLLYLLLKVPQPAGSTESAQPTGAARQAAEAIDRSGRRVFAIVLTLILMVPALGYGILAVYTPVEQQHAFDDLQSIASLKAEQTELWREGMVAIIAGVPEMGQVARDLELIDAGEAGVLSDQSLEALRNPLQSYALAAIIVLNADGREVARLGEAGAVQPQTLQLLDSVAASGQTLNGDIFIAPPPACAHGHRAPTAGQRPRLRSQRLSGGAFRP